MSTTPPLRRGQTLTFQVIEGADPGFCLICCEPECEMTIKGNFFVGTRQYEWAIHRRCFEAQPSNEDEP